MKKRSRSIAIILVAIAVTFTSLPIMTGDFKVHAISRPTGTPIIRNTVANSARKTNDVIWDTSSIKGANAYEISWKHKNSTQWVSRTVGNVNRGVTSGLSIGGLYQAKVRPLNRSGGSVATGSWSPIVYRYFHTTQGIRLASNSVGSFTMSWTKNPQATSYQVLFSTNSNCAGAANNINTVGANATSFTKTGLVPGRMYYVQVREIKKIGNINYIGNISCPVAVRVKGGSASTDNNTTSTPESPASVKPGKVTGLKASATTQNSITISWTKLSNNVTGYAIYRNDKYVTIVGKNVSSYKNTGLSAGKSYTYKVRAYYKSGSKYTYGAYSAALTASTNKAPTPAPAPSPSVRDTKFANSKLSDKTLYIDKSYVGTNDLYYELQTSKEDADSIKWSSSNTNVVEIQRSVMIGIRSKITIKGKGTATITATNWDGQKKTATVTVKGTTYGNFAFSGTTPTKIDKSASKEVTYTLPGSGFSASWTSSNTACVSVSTSGSNAIRLYAGDTFGQAVIKGTLSTPSGSSYTGQTEIKITVQNALYPLDSSGAYVMTIDPYGWPIVGGVSETRSPEQIILSLPRDAKVKMDIPNINSGLPDWKVYGYGFLLGRGHTVSTTTPNLVYISGEKVYFYNSGTANLTIDNVRREFILTGKNDILCEYFAFVKDMAQNASGTTAKERLQSITRYIASSENFSSGQGMNPANMYRTKIGDCINGAGMAIDIFNEMGYEAGYYKPSSNSSHQDVYVIIDGVSYRANCTPGSNDGFLYQM